MQLSNSSSIAQNRSPTTKSTHLLIRVVSSETLTRLLNRERLVILPSQCVMRAFQICIYIPSLYDDPWLIFKVRRNETICCLIGFGIGVGCCILYRLISNFFTSSSSTEALLSHNSNSLLSNDKRDAKSSLMGQDHSSLTSNGQDITVSYSKRPRPTTLKRPTPEKNLIKANYSKRSSKDDVSSSIDSKRESSSCPPIGKTLDSNSSKNLTSSHISDDVAWSEISSSLGTVAPLHDSYHSNSMTTDSGVDCYEISTMRCARHEYDHPRFNDTLTSLPMVDHDDDNESFLNCSTGLMTTIVHGGPRRYDSDTALSRTFFLHDSQNTTADSNSISFMSTEKGLERALEQTSRFYSDLEHIATDLNSLSKKYSLSQTTVTPSVSKYYRHHNKPILNTIDALDWDWNDADASPIVQSPKSPHRKIHTHHSSSSLSRLNNSKSRGRRRILTNSFQTDYNESDLEIHVSRSYDCTSSPLKRRASSVYFDSTDNTSDDDNIANETLQIPSSPTVLIPSQTTEFTSTAN